jgi:arylformamidase
MTLYRGYDATGIEAQYNARASIPDHPRIFARWKERSAAARKARAGRARLDIAYGPGPLHTLDIFLADTRNAPLHMLIHGGYWRSLDKSDFSDKVGALVEAGVTVAAVNYSLCPAVTIAAIVEETRQAAAWLWREAPALGCDQARFQISGHSAGGHLTAMLVATDWPRYAPDLPKTMIQSALSASGIFELEPLRHCSMNQDIKLAADDARSLSPIFMTPPAKVPMALAYGGLESAEFKRQSEDFAKAWRRHGLTIGVEELPGLNHLTVIEELAVPGGRLATTALRLLGMR